MRGLLGWLVVGAMAGWILADLKLDAQLTLTQTGVPGLTYTIPAGTTPPRVVFAKTMDATIEVCVEQDSEQPSYRCHSLRTMRTTWQRELP